MSRTVRRLQQSAIREGQIQDEAIDVFERQLAQLVTRFMRRLRADLVDWEVDDAARLVSTSANLGRALALRRQLGAWLLEEGFLELSARVLAKPLDELAASVFATSRIANEAARLSSFTDTLNALKELRLADLLDIGEDIARDLSRIAFEGVTSLRPVDSLVLDVADRLEVTQRQARTIYDTAVSTYARQVELLNADGTDDELFVYVGPADIKNREFCHERVGRVFRRDEIDEMDNGQMPDVFISGGGYNCRHTWKRVSVLDAELAALAVSGDRVPEIAEQIARAA